MGRNWCGRARRACPAPAINPRIPPRMPQVRGEKVVVKVQRPGLKDLFDIDLKNVRVLAQLLQKVNT